MKSFKRNFMAVLIPVILLLAALACQRSQTTPVTTVQEGDQLHTFSVNGLERIYLLHVPRGLDLGQPSPLVLVFHSYSGNAEAARLISGFNRIADEEYFIVVYPNGTGDDASTLSWNGGRCCFYARDNNIEDVGFTRQMIADIESCASIDPKRIYAAGMSNGGIFSYRLACEMSATFAAVAPVAGSLVYEPCQPEQPISVIHVHGLYDNVVPYNGTGALPELSDVGFHTGGGRHHFLGGAERLPGRNTGGTGWRDHPHCLCPMPERYCRGTAHRRRDRSHLAAAQDPDLARDLGFLQQHITSLEIFTQSPPSTSLPVSRNARYSAFRHFWGAVDPLLNLV